MITGVTRRAIIELFRTYDPDPYGFMALTSLKPARPVGINWSGDLDELEFLGRLYDLESMPSTDSRYPNAEGDIIQHRYNNNDLEDDYIFSDDRFKLNSSDTALLNFLSETLHPEVRSDREEVNQIRARLNDILRPDLYQLQQVKVISGLPVLGAVAIQPRKITTTILQDQIAEAVWAKGPSAPNLPAYFTSLGLPLPEDDLVPEASKRMYVKNRLQNLDRNGLIKIAREIAEDCPYDGLIDLLNELDSETHAGQTGQPKNLIFAADGFKPEIVLSDSVDNEIRITKNEQFCLVYADHIDPNQGLTWNDLISWWKKEHGSTDDSTANHELFQRLLQSCNDAEKMIFVAYGHLLRELGFEIPALIPQVYLHFDPLTFKQRGGVPSPLIRQRMDFLMLLPRRYRIVVELDGIEHYTDANGKASMTKYAEMMAEDRRLRLSGYEVYRFGGADFTDKMIGNKIKKFFNDLFDRYDIKDNV